MIEVLITVVPAVLWLLYRFFLVLQTPVEKLIEDLNIEIPHTPILCIDSISERSIVIHWDIEIKFDENLYYVIVVNEQEAATLTSTSCRLNNLTPHQLYQIEIIAVNSITNFKSQSKPVFVHTSNDKELDGIVNVDHLETEIKEIEPISGTLDQSALETITIDQIKNIKDSNLLNDYIVKFQNELAKTNTEYKQFQSSISQEHETLQRDLSHHKREFEEESDNRLKKDHDLKSLERKKDNLSFQKSKLTTQLNALKNTLSLFNTKFEENENKIKKLREKNTHALNTEDQEKTKIKQEVDSIKQKISNTKSEMEKTEENMKLIALERKELISILNQLKPLIDAFNQAGSSNTQSDNNGVSQLLPSSLSSATTANNTAVSNTSTTATATNNTATSVFNRDGSLSKNAFDAIVKIIQIVPSWQDEIMHEINQYQEFEQNWKEAFRAEIKKFVSIHQALEVARMNLDQNYQPVKMTEYQASIEFGGFSNALPKPKFNGKRNLSPTEDHLKQNNNFYNYYGNVYSKEESDGELGSPHSQQQVLLKQQQQQPQSQQHQPLPPPIAPQVLSNNDYLPSNSFGHQEQPYISLDQINAAHNLDLNSGNTLMPIDTSISTNNLASTHLNGFPYDDNIYTRGINSPLPLHNNAALNYGDYNSLLYRYSSPSLTQSNSNLADGVWGTTTNNGNNLSANDLLNPTQQSGFLISPSQSTNIWLDDKSQNSLLNPTNGTHTRAVSSNSQIWRNDATSLNGGGGSNPIRGFDFGGVSTQGNGDFSPFGNNISIHNPTDSLYGVNLSNTQVNDQQLQSQPQSYLQQQQPHPNLTSFKSDNDENDSAIGGKEQFFK